MKSRRNFVVAILLVAIMCIGVGFATMSSTLGLIGTVTYKPAFSIEWQDGSAKLDNVALESTIGDTQFGEDTVSTLQFTIDTTDWTVGQSHEITAIVKNDLKYAAENVKVQELTTTAVSSYYNVTVELEDNATTIAANGTLNVIITITMTKYPQVDETFNADFTFKVYAEQDV